MNRLLIMEKEMKSSRNSFLTKRLSQGKSHSSFFGGVRSFGIDTTKAIELNLRNQAERWGSYKSKILVLLKLPANTEVGTSTFAEAVAEYQRKKKIPAGKYFGTLGGKTWTSMRIDLGLGDTVNVGSKIEEDFKRSIENIIKEYPSTKITSSGRRSVDKQMYFVKKRPTEYPATLRKVFKDFNLDQSKINNNEFLKTVYNGRDNWLRKTILETAKSGKGFFHLQGKAIDVRVRDLNLSSKQQLLDKLKANGYHVILERIAGSKSKYGVAIESANVFHIDLMNSHNMALNTDGNNMAFNIDWNLIHLLENSRNLTKAVVPNFGTSGVTIADGFDLGHQNRNSLEALHLPNSIILKLVPYFGLQREKAKEKLSDKPLDLSTNELAIINEKLRKYLPLKLEKEFNARSNFKFRNLPKEAQTVIYSVYHQYGNLNRTPLFFGYVTTKNWKAAVDELNDFKDDYSTRRRKEARLLSNLL